MMRLFLNGLAASAGAGLTYFRNVIPELSARGDVQTTVALTPALRSEFGEPANISFLEVSGATAGRRFWQEQTELPELIRRDQADVLVSTGNFALRRSPVPQILLSGNSLYTSRDFYSDLRTRREYRMWLGTRIRGILAKRSVHWADCTVAPSEAFAADLRRWTGENVISIYHGFDHDAFLADEEQVPGEMAAKLSPEPDALRLLFVSHYNYYRNFETLFRALPHLKQRFHNLKIKLFLTCQLQPGANPGTYQTATASRLVRELGVGNEIVELGTTPYRLLHHVYNACDIYVTPAYTETFAHPLVEAMACGRPIVASDLPVHREICGSAGIFFDRFSPEALAEQVSKIAGSPQLARDLSERGLARSREFSWRCHVDQIVALARELLQRAHTVVAGAAAIR